MGRQRSSITALAPVGRQGSARSPTRLMIASVGPSGLRALCIYVKALGKEKASLALTKR